MVDDVDMAPLPFKPGEVVASLDHPWDSDIRLLRVDRDDDSFLGESIDRPGVLFSGDLENVGRRTSALERWSSALAEVMRANGEITQVDALLRLNRTMPELFDAVRLEHPILKAYVRPED